MPVPAGNTSGSYSSLVTPADIRAEINATSTANDTELAGFAAAAQELVEQEVGPVIPRSVVEVFDGGAPVVVLNYYPIMSIDSVTEYSGGRASTLAAVAAPFSDSTGLGYRADLDIGVLYRWSGVGGGHWRTGLQNVIVSYTAGRPSVPPAIRDAALEVIRVMWQTQQGGSRPNGYVDTELNTGPAFRLPYRALEALRPYARAPRIV